MVTIGKRTSLSYRTIKELVAPLQTDIVLAWGVHSESSFGGKQRIYGVEQLVRFKESGVFCPEFTVAPCEAYQWSQSGHTVLGRKYNHSQGKHIVFINQVSPTRWPYLSDYWVKAIPNVVEEWRIHVLNGWYIGQGRKVNTMNDLSVLPIRSRKLGWKIDHSIMPPQFIKDAAKRAVKSLGYDFGAVDVLQTQSGEACVLEVNKAPGLDNYTAARYTRALERMVNDNSSNSIGNLCS